MAVLAPSVTADSAGLATNESSVAAPDQTLPGLVGAWYGNPDWTRPKGGHLLRSLSPMFRKKAFLLTVLALTEFAVASQTADLTNSVPHYYNTPENIAQHIAATIWNPDEVHFQK